jgi:hypothetical protein
MILYLCVLIVFSVNPDRGSVTRMGRGNVATTTGERDIEVRQTNMRTTNCLSVHPCLNAYITCMRKQRPLN